LDLSLFNDDFLFLEREKRLKNNFTLSTTCNFYEFLYRHQDVQLQIAIIEILFRLTPKRALHRERFAQTLFDNDQDLISSFLSIQTGDFFKVSKGEK